jgi:hypothetical protein
VLAHGIGQGLAGAGPQEADDTMVGVFQFPLIDVTVFIVDPPGSRRSGRWCRSSGGRRLTRR